MAVSRMDNEKMQYYTYLMAESPKFPRLIGVGEKDGDFEFNTGSGNMAASCTRNQKICNITVIIGTVRSLWSWLSGRYHVPQNVFPV